jgi:hypothetical protein
VTSRVCVGLLTVLALGACKGSRPPKPAKVTDPAQPMLGKLQGYINCLQDHSSRVFQAADLYKGRLDGKAPSAGAPVVLHATLDPEKCLAAVIAARQMPPSNLELDTAGAGFVSALSAVYALTRDGEGFYDPASPTYAPAKGVALHDKLIAAFDEFDRAQGVLFDRVTHLNREAHVAQLAAREKVEGRSLGVRADAITLHAEEIVRQTATTAEHLDALDLPALQTQLLKLEEELQDLTAYAGANGKEVTDFVGYFQLEDQIRGFVIACKQLVNRATQRLAYTDSEKLMIASGNEMSVPGTPASVIAAYNRVVDFYGVH